MESEVIQSPQPPREELTEVALHVEWVMPKKLAEPWVKFIASRWEHKVTKQSAADVIGMTVVQPGGFQPISISLDMVSRYENAWPVSGGEIRECIKALGEAVTMLEMHYPKHDRAVTELWNNLAEKLRRRVANEPPALKVEPDELLNAEAQNHD